MAKNKRVHINPDGFDELMRRIVEKIERVDRGIRKELTGRPATRIAPIAEQRFAEIGAPLTPTDAAAYSESVETDEPINR